MEKKDLNKKIKAEAKSKAAEVFTNEDVAQQKARLTEIFEEHETDLQQLAEANKKALDDNTELVDQIENLKRDKETLEAEKTEVLEKATKLEEDLSNATKKIEELEKLLNDVKAEATLKVRISELEEAGLISSGKTAEKQMARIKSMTDEEYADYKEELSDLFSSLKKSLEEKKEEKKEVLKKGESASESTESEASTEDKKPEEGEEDSEEDSTNVSMAELIALKRQVASFAGTAGSEVNYEDKLSEYAALWDEDKSE